MWNEQKRFLDSQISSGERLLWSGQPRQGLFFRTSDAFTIPFSLLWCGFAIFWESGVIYTDAPLLFKLWGIPFVCVGLYMVVGRFFVDAKSRGKTYYGVTNERVIIVSGIFTKKVESLNLKTLPNLSIEEKADRSGTITFGTDNSNTRSNFSKFSRNSEPEVPTFDSIQDAKAVYETIRHAQKTAVG